MKGILYITNLGSRIQMKYLTLVFVEVFNSTCYQLHMSNYFIIKIYINTVIKNVHKIYIHFQQTAF